MPTHYLFLFSFFVCEFCVGFLFCGVVLGVLSSQAIILLRKRELVALSEPPFIDVMYENSECSDESARMRRLV